MVGAEERLEAVLLGGGREGAPLVPGHALLALDHQAHAHVPDNRAMIEVVVGRGDAAEEQTPQAIVLYDDDCGFCRWTLGCC